MNSERIYILLGGLVCLIFSTGMLNLSLTSHFGSLSAAYYWIMKNHDEQTLISSFRTELFEISAKNLTDIFVSLWLLILGVTLFLGSLILKNFLPIARIVFVVGLGGFASLMGLAAIIKREIYGILPIKGFFAIIGGAIFVLGGLLLCIFGIRQFIK